MEKTEKKNVVGSSDGRTVGKSLVLVSDLTGSDVELVSSGEVRRVRQNNQFLDQIGKIMDDPQFRSFFDEYFKNWGDGKAVLMIMYTYTFMDDFYYSKVGKRLSSDRLVYLIKKMLSNSDCRRLMAECTNNMLQSDGKFHDHMEEILIENFSELRVLGHDEK